MNNSDLRLSLRFVHNIYLSEYLLRDSANNHRLYENMSIEKKKERTKRNQGRIEQKRNDGKSKETPSKNDHSSSTDSGEEEDGDM